MSILPNKLPHRKRYTIRSLQYGFQLSQGYIQELAGIKDLIEAYETLTRVTQTGEKYGYASMR